jgi:hypothetical protein
MIAQKRDPLFPAVMGECFVGSDQSEEDGYDLQRLS